ncbi:FAD-dependent oxidoreductase [Nocardioides sp. Kera G14]|uniref:FAD-dependent oxidoreductase n=1 Tax=Nocardioides sp. Kera G14 TaxID=2884264 RepID=UPI001D0FED9E|nr:FAD-dependent oxidoreductase [Nocardioides sp. Kera G14]UDY24029.1 DUF1365 family protein [Nocardioides sp. Kera G14]
MQSPRPRRIAVIGSGVSGLVAAQHCAAGAEVTLFEADDRLGGHADTHEVVEETPRGPCTLAIDTGFIVHNRLTYPTLIRVFEDLGVPTQPSEMSMSIADETTGVEWAGARGVRGVLPNWARLTDRRHLAMLAEIPRFHRAARALLAREGEDEGSVDGPGDLTTLTDFLDQHGFSERLRSHFIEPLVAAVWSCDPELAGQYPALYLFRFLAHHQMLSVSGSPTWRTVTGGSRSYVDRIAAHLEAHGGRILTGTPVRSVLEEDDSVTVVAASRADGTELRDRYDAVVIATHPHQALAMLAAATPEQKEVLSAIEYSPNTAVLHTDTRLLPAERATWGSWNFRRRATSTGHVTVTYDLTRLQRLDTETRYLVTLGGSDLIDPASVIAGMDYEHPLYTPTSVAAQSRLAEIGSDRVVFAGAYHGWGFHEDGARSGAAAAARLGIDRRESPAHRAPTVYATRITHQRREPWRRRFQHRSLLWVTDLDAAGTSYPAGQLNRVRSWFTGAIEARDHLGDPGRSVRENLTAFLASEGLQLGRGRVTVAAHPRAWGHCFNPISVFWCRDEAREPLATVVEVHNTYGDRHAYLLPPGSETVSKAMYVSPFHGVDGRYRVLAPEPQPGGRLDLAIDLVTADGARFSASLRGEPVRGHGRRAALVGARDALLIRAHGLALWARRLPVHPRPIHHQEGVS